MDVTFPAGSWPFGDLQPFRYGCIISDPPWRFENYSAKGEAKNPVLCSSCTKARTFAPVGDYERTAYGDAAYILPPIKGL